MDRNLLYKYFKDEATDEELLLILDWVDQSEDNRKELESERLLFDVSTFSSQPIARRHNVARMLRIAVGAAASVAVIVGCTIFAQSHLFVSEPTVQMVMTPVGQQTQMVLPDGSKVWLNSKSTLSYSSDFGKGSRDVKLNGEAYFEVAKNKDVPFNVNTEYNRVRVVGTHFNVRAYNGTNRFETSLLQGCVEIYDSGNSTAVARLTPNEYYSEVDGVGTKSRLTAHEYQDWKDGIIRFDDVNFTDMMDKLSIYYNVKVIINNNKLSDYRCTGKFKGSDGIEHILDVIQKDRTFRYNYNKASKSITIE